MRKYKKGLVIMLAFVMSVMTLLAGCGGGGGSSSSEVTSMQQNVTVGKKVYIDQSGVVFFGYKNLICTAVLKDGEISEFVPEGGTTGNIFGMAVYNDELYISASDGMFKYPLSMFTSGDKNASATTLIDPDHSLSPFSHFEIFENRIFFIYGTTLYYVPTDGGERTSIAEEVVDFEVTDKGIYYTKADGDMVLLSTSFDKDKNLGNVGGVKFTPGGMNFFYRLGSKLMAFSVEKEAAEEISTDKGVYEYCVPFSNGDSVLYYDDDGMKMHIVSSGKDKAFDTTRLMPFKADAAVSGKYLVSQSDNYSIMEIIDLSDGTHKEYDLDTEMKSYLDKIGGGGGTGQDSNPEPQTTGDYDMRKGMAMEASSDTKAVYFYFNDFMITMPNKKYLGHLEEKDSVTFFHTGADTDGFGGRLVTLRAYDLNDKSYENIPNYHVAGVCRNANVRIVAIYPSDLQCDPNNSTQKAEYQELYDYVQKIGEGAANSPLQFADSD